MLLDTQVAVPECEMYHREGVLLHYAQAYVHVHRIESGWGCRPTLISPVLEILIRERR